jgi:hypothetical protein
VRIWDLLRKKIAYVFPLHDIADLDSKRLYNITLMFCYATYENLHYAKKKIESIMLRYFESG